MNLRKITAGLAFSAALVLWTATDVCGPDSDLAVAPAVFDDSTVETEDDLEQLAASAREEHERKQAAQIEAIEAVQANGWKGWHPPYEPIGD